MRLTGGVCELPISVNDLDLSLSENGADSHIDLTAHGGGAIILADFTGPLSADDELIA